MMPLGIFGIFIFCATIIWTFTLLTIKYAEKREKVIVIAILTIFTLSTGLTLSWYFSTTAAGKRAWKTQESNFNGGIQREVKVYSVDGKLIQEYKGKFDVEYDDDRILFDDEKGHRHIIYYPTGIVTIDEVDE